MLRRPRYTKEQIIGVLKEHALGAKRAYLCRKHQISKQTFYNWKSRYGERGVCEGQRLKELEMES